MWREVFSFHAGKCKYIRSESSCPKSKQRKRRLTAKQKYNAASAHLHKIKAVINDGWKKHGAASGS